LREAGGPELPLPRPVALHHQVPSLVALARSQAASDVGLDLIACLLAQHDAAAPAPNSAIKPFLPWLKRRLHKWHKRGIRKAQCLRALDDEQLHRLRKRGKRIRLVTNLYATLWHEGRAQQHDDALRAALDALGNIQNEVVAAAWYAAHAEAEPAARFGQGWLAARRPALRRKARKALERWMKVRTPW
jgi:CHAD domain-containing protein